MPCFSGLRRRFRANLWLTLAASIAFAVVMSAGLARAQTQSSRSSEIREYDVLMKDSPVGKVSITTTENPDGSATSVTDTAVNVRYFLVTYHYHYHGKETWQNDRLLRLDSSADDDGTKLAVTALTDSRFSRIDVQGSAPRNAPPLVMTSNYWRLPDLRLTNGSFAIVDSDTGKLFSVQMRRVGTDVIPVGNENIACDHYRVSGDTAAELWYDGRRRLVRQQTVEQGHQTEMRLMRIRATATSD